MSRKRAESPLRDPDVCIAKAERIIGHRFSDRTLILRALTHPSALEDSPLKRSYERLEFLGDSIVGFTVAEEIFDRFPDMLEGGMTRIKISLVSGATLSAVAAELGFEEAIVFGASYQGTGGRGIASALENVYESTVAALYLDAGLDVARDWVLATLGPRISADTADSPENPKSSLQEALQAQGILPTYRVVGHSGPPHDRVFTAEALAGDKVIGAGTGTSKKEAEAAAAAEALRTLP